MQYQINDLERLTGIKAHTIRIWEKRYSLISPERTATNRRYYDDAQVRKLLNVSTLLSQGKKISKIAALSDDELFELVAGAASSALPDQVSAAFINDLLKSMLAFNEATFEKIITAAIARFGVYDMMLNVIYPFLHKTGVLWTIDQSSPAQEHFATNIIRRKLFSAIDGLMPPTSGAKKFLLFLPPGEWHEIGLLLANYVIRAKGHETVYLGQNVPFENIATIVPKIKPDFMLCFFVATRPAEETINGIQDYANIDRRVRLLVAGAINEWCDQIPTPKNVTYIRAVNGLQSFL